MTHHFMIADRKSRQSKGDKEYARLDFLRQLETGQPEERCGTSGQVYEQHPIDLLPVLIENSDVCEALCCRVLHYFLQSYPLCTHDS